MYKQKELLQMIDHEIERHAAVLKKMKTIAPALPEGHLYCSKRDGYYYQTIYADNKQFKLRIQEHTQEGRMLIKDLQLKKALRYNLSVMRKNLTTLKKAASNFKAIESEEIIFPNGSVSPSEWLNMPYKTNPYHPEHLIVGTKRGTLARSKSEASIDDELADANILFRYECGILMPDGRTIFPDFMILRPHDRRIILWEHLGLLTNPNYVAASLARLQNLADAGFHFGEDLIITWETPDDPFTSAKARAVIKDKIQCQP
ncbi:MAG: hypothetical protein VB031_10035 [Eubacteriaceae bacterium]|nr:hypothetical protein [Eubacteriaceae bacterium]